MSQEAPTKICTNCGQRKSLSAFLQMNKAGTASHGQICASCRKTLAEKAARPQGEDAGTQETGQTIGTKARIQAERDKREHQATVHEDYHENRDLNAIDAKSTEHKRELKQQTEKKVRESMFGKQGFLSEKKQAPSATAAQEKVQTQQHNATEERKKTQHDFTLPYHDPQIAGQLRFQSATFQKTFQEFQRRLGKDSPLVRAAENAVKRTGKEADKNKSTTLEEHVEKTWEPPKPRR